MTLNTNSQLIPSNASKMNKPVLVLDVSEELVSILLPCLITNKIKYLRHNYPFCLTWTAPEMTGLTLPRYRYFLNAKYRLNRTYLKY